MISSLKPHVLVLALAFAVGGCVDEAAKHLRPLSFTTVAALKAKNMDVDDPILIRIFKEEDELEVWKKRDNGRYAFFKSYDICKWSGELGPKIKQGDRQAPEGFYTVTPAQMNPNSSYHLSFNIGYPNTFDRAHGRTGEHLMVHGACSSAGCYAMSDEVIQEIYALAREAFRGGQREFQVQALPFRMTPENMARHADNPNMPFWRNLKLGSDHFEVTGLPPAIGVCDRQYVFNAKPADPNRRLDPLSVCPVLEVPQEIEMAVADKQRRDETAFQVALAEVRGRAVGMTPALTTLAYNDVEQGSTDYPLLEPEQSVDDTVRDTSEAAAPAEPAGQASGVWSRLLGFARLDVLRLSPPMPEPLVGPAMEQGSQTPPAETPHEPAAAPAPAPIAAGFAAPTRSRRPSAPSVPAPVAADFAAPAYTAFAPPAFRADPFAVFGLFESVDGVWVPADTVAR